MTETPGDLLPLTGRKPHDIRQATGYTRPMIKRFRHKGLEKLFTKGDTSGINPQFAPKLRRMLTLLMTAGNRRG